MQNRNISEISKKNESIEPQFPTTQAFGYPLLFILLMIGVTVVLAPRIDATQLQRMIAWLQEQPIGVMLTLFSMLYLTFTLAGLPTTFLSISAGFLFDVIPGLIIVSLVSTFSAGIAFLISRHLAREPIQRKLSANTKYRRLASMARTYGGQVVVILRIIPIIPFPLVNYGLGLTPISLVSYLFWSWLSMLPISAFFVFSGHAAYESVVVNHIPWQWLILILFSLLLLSIVSKMIIHKLNLK